jgi:two-component system chemotaxis response regulator CheY
MENVRIGIVEDESEVASLYQTCLLARGMSVAFIAGDGLEAINAFTNCNPKPIVVIMDHRMPQMTGIDSMKKMLELYSGTKYIIVSADSGIKNEAIQAGASMFLEKPIQLKQLISCVEQLLRQ